jgi:hypothetical protein
MFKLKSLIMNVSTSISPEVADLDVFSRVLRRGAKAALVPRLGRHMTFGGFNIDFCYHSCLDDQELTINKLRINSAALSLKSVI